MKIIINIILNLAAVIYNISCIALNNLNYIIAVRKAEFKIKHSIVQCPLCGICVECDTEMYLN